MLTSCPHCGHQVHNTAKKCPSCAGPTLAGQQAQRDANLFVNLIFTWPIYGFLILGFIGMIFLK